MKKRLIMVIPIIILIMSIIVETIVLHDQNIEIRAKTETMISELEENNLVIDGKVSLQTVIEEKDKVKEETQKLFATETFKVDEVQRLIENEKVNSENITNEIKSLEEKVVGLEDTVSSLQLEYNKLYNAYQAQNTFLIPNVPYINQYPNYPTGCESVALTILLKYYGVSVTTDAIIDRLPKGSLPYYKDGKLYGGNPEVEFIGNPRSQNSYGVYEKPLAGVANEFKPGIKIATGTSFSEILKIVKSGTPVIVWTSMGLSMPYVSTSWTYEPTGETIYWKANEHAVVLIGYTLDKVIISDPIGGKMKYQSKSVFEERYNYYGKKALYY